MQRADGQAWQGVLASYVTGVDRFPRYSARGSALPRKRGVAYPPWLLLVQQTATVLSMCAQVLDGSFDLFLVFLDSLQDR